MSRNQFLLSVGVLSVIVVFSVFEVKHTRADAPPPSPSTSQTKFLPSGSIAPSSDFLSRADIYKLYSDRISDVCLKGQAKSLTEMTICQQVEVGELQRSVPSGMQYDPTFRAFVPLPKQTPVTPTVPVLH